MNSEHVAQTRMWPGIRPATRSYLAGPAPALYLQFFALCLLGTAAAGQGLPDTKLSILVYDAAQVGSKTLEQSEGVAGTIMLKAGIQSRWDVGPVEDLGDLGMDFTAYLRSECHAGPISGLVRLQILSHAPAGWAGQALGFCLPCARRGLQVTIYADRIADVSKTGGPTFSRLLALCDGA